MGIRHAIQFTILSSDCVNTEPLYDGLPGRPGKPIAKALVGEDPVQLVSELPGILPKQIAVDPILYHNPYSRYVRTY